MGGETICGKIAEEFPALRARMAERERVGMERYGRPLDPSDGRCWVSEAREELSDALVYLSAATHVLAGAEQGVDAFGHWVLLRRMRRQIAEMLVELE
jgi:hypothetical protein